MLFSAKVMAVLAITLATFSAAAPVAHGGNEAATNAKPVKVVNARDFSEFEARDETAATVSFKKASCFSLPKTSMFFVYPRNKINTDALPLRMPLSRIRLLTNLVRKPLR